MADELDKWKRSLIEKPTQPDKIVQIEPSRDMNEENKELDQMSDEELLDFTKKEEKKIEEARARRRALMEQLNKNQKGGEGYDDPKPQIESNDQIQDSTENIGFLEETERHLEDIADFEVHDKDGVLIEPMTSQHQKNVNSHKSKKEYDMFAESDSSDQDSQEEFANLEGKNKERHLDFDDDEQYYRSQVGEVLQDSFKILSLMGKGVYGSVVKAQEISTERVVAIKVAGV